MTAGTEAARDFLSDTGSFREAFARGYDLALEQICQHIDMHRWYAVLPDGRVIANGDDGLVIFEDHGEYLNFAEGS